MNECVIEEIKMKHLEENYDIVVGRYFHGHGRLRLRQKHPAARAHGP